jgi:putative acetyltransferase
MLVISQVDSDEEIRAAQDLTREFTTWAFTLDHVTGEEPTFEKLEEELAGLDAYFAPPKGLLLLAVKDGQPAGCVALKRHDASTCELKRLYVRPTNRGQGIGRELVRTLVENARQDGYERIVLDSHVSMKAAHALYRSFGFKTVRAPDGFPEDFEPYVVFLECALSGAN